VQQKLNKIRKVGECTTPGSDKVGEGKAGTDEGKKKLNAESHYHEEVKLEGCLNSVRAKKVKNELQSTAEGRKEA